MKRAIRLAVASAAFCASIATLAQADPGGHNPGNTKTPIRHVIILFQENVSFDHYFATYPVAQNPPGEPAFPGSASRANS